MCLFFYDQLCRASGVLSVLFHTAPRLCTREEDLGVCKQEAGTPFTVPNAWVTKKELLKQTAQHWDSISAGVLVSVWGCYCSWEFVIVLMNSCLKAHKMQQVLFH